MKTFTALMLIATMSLHVNAQEASRRPQPQPQPEAQPPESRELRMYGDQLTIHNKRAGDLKSKITKDITNRVRRLTIEGPINRDDATALRNICKRITCRDDRNRIVDNYVDIDLSRARLESSFGHGSDEAYNDMFYGADHLRSIRLPIRLRSIGRRAFQGCKILDTVEMPNGVRVFSEDAFRDCEHLEGIRMPEMLEEIGDNCFYGCTSLTYITLPSSIRTIGDKAFYNCPLNELFLPQGLQSLGTSSLQGTRLRTIYIAGNTHIEGTPGNNTSLESITVSPDNPEYADIDGVLFTKNRRTLLLMPAALHGDYTIPQGVTSIASYAFNGSKLSSITLPSSINTIGEGAFAHCTQLTSMTLPQGVSSVSASMLRGCSALHSISLPESVTSIGVEAFSGCLQLSEVTLPVMLKTIGKGAFSSCSSLRSIIIPQAVTSLPEECFLKCQNLESVTFPARLLSIGNEAFRECANLSTLHLPEALETLGNEVFRSCDHLVEITLPASLLKIGKKPFNKCSQLQRIVSKALIPPELKSNGSEKIPLVVPIGCMSSYKKASQWKKFKNISEQ